MLRLKQYVSSDVRPPHIDAILDALADNTRVEVLYIQNFEWVSAGLIFSWTLTVCTACVLPDGMPHVQVNKPRILSKCC